MSRCRDRADGTEGVGNRIYVVGIVVEVLELIVYLTVERDVLGGIDRLDELLGYEAGDHIVGGNNYVVAYGTARKLCVKVLVARVGGVVDLYLFTVFFKVVFFKLFVDVYGVFASVGDVFTPVVNVKRPYVIFVAAFA